MDCIHAADHVTHGDLADFFPETTPGPLAALIARAPQLRCVCPGGQSGRIFRAQLLSEWTPTCVVKGCNEAPYTTGRGGFATRCEPHSRKRGIAKIGDRDVNA